MPNFENTYIMSIFIVIAITADVYTAALFTLVYYFIDRLLHIALDEYERAMRLQNNRLEPAHLSTVLSNVYSNTMHTIPTVPLAPVSRHSAGGRSRRTSSICRSRVSSDTAVNTTS